MNWYTQQLSTAEHAAAGVFSPFPPLPLTRLSEKWHVSICFIYSLKCKYSTHIFPEWNKIKNKSKSQGRMIVFCNVKSVRIQPNIANLVQTCRINELYVFTSTIFYIFFAFFVACCLLLICHWSSRGFPLLRA